MNAEFYPLSQVASERGTNASSFRERGIGPLSATATPGAAVIPVGTVSRLVDFSPVPVLADYPATQRPADSAREHKNYRGGNASGALAAGEFNGMVVGRR